jgi:hypothetical protein
MEPEKLRRLFIEEPEIDAGQYGCPMLMRAREIYAPGVELPTHRCHFGWSVRGESEIEQCMAVETPLECWKVARERAVVPFPPPSPRHQSKASAD